MNSDFGLIQSSKKKKKKVLKKKKKQQSNGEAGRTSGSTSASSSLSDLDEEIVPETTRANQPALNNNNNNNNNSQQQPQQHRNNFDDDDDQNGNENDVNNLQHRTSQLQSAFSPTERDEGFVVVAQERSSLPPAGAAANQQNTNIASNNNNNNNNNANTYEDASRTASGAMTPTDDPTQPQQQQQQQKQPQQQQQRHHQKRDKKSSSNNSSNTKNQDGGGGAAAVTAESQAAAPTTTTVVRRKVPPTDLPVDGAADAAPFVDDNDEGDALKNKISPRGGENNNNNNNNNNHNGNDDDDDHQGQLDAAPNKSNSNDVVAGEGSSQAKNSTSESSTTKPLVPKQKNGVAGVHVVSHSAPQSRTRRISSANGGVPSSSSSYHQHHQQQSQAIHGNVRGQLARVDELHKLWLTHAHNLYMFCTSHVLQYPTMVVEWLSDSRREIPMRDFSVAQVVVGSFCGEVPREVRKMQKREFDERDHHHQQQRLGSAQDDGNNRNNANDNNNNNNNGDDEQDDAKSTSSSASSSSNTSSSSSSSAASSSSSTSSSSSSSSKKSSPESAADKKARRAQQKQLKRETRKQEKELAKANSAKTLAKKARARLKLRLKLEREARGGRRQNFLTVYRVFLHCHPDFDDENEDEAAQFAGMRGRFQDVAPLMQRHQRVLVEGPITNVVSCPHQPTMVAFRGLTPEIHLVNLDYRAPEPPPEAKRFVADLTLTGHTMPGHGIAWAPDNSGRILTSANDETVQLFSLASHLTHAGINARSTYLAPVVTLRGHTDCVDNVSWHGKQPSLCGSCSRNGELMFWDLRQEGGSVIKQRENIHRSVALYDLAFHPQADFLLATAGADRVVRVWDIRNFAEPCSTLVGHTGEVRGVRWAPFSDTVLMSHDSDGGVFCWDIAKRFSNVGESGQVGKSADDLHCSCDLVFRHLGHTGAVRSARWCPFPEDEWTVASCDDNNIVQMWSPHPDIYNDDIPVEDDIDDVV